MSRPIYLGPDSCYAYREGIYVKPKGHPGIDTIAEALGILYLILRDKRRGWSYDDKGPCRRIRMGHELFVKRVNYVSVLAKKHGATRRELHVIDYLADYVKKHSRLPRGYGRKARRAIARKRSRARGRR